MDIYDGLCISGGGWKGIEQLGALHYYYESGIYDEEQCKVYTGTSVGSMIALLLVCGYSPMEIFQAIYSIKSISSFGGIDFWELIKNFGLLNINVLMEKIIEMVTEKIRHVPTLHELYKLTGKYLVVCVANLSTRSGVYLSARTHPRLKVTDAVKISCNLPLFFQRLRYKGQFHCDGGLADNLPYKKAFDYGAKNVLCVMVNNESVNNTNMNFLSYLYNIVMLPIYANTELRHREALRDPRVKVLAIMTAEKSFDISLTSEEKMSMFLRGYEEAKFEESLIPIYVPGWDPSNIDIHDGWELEMGET